MLINSNLRTIELSFIGIALLLICITMSVHSYVVNEEGLDEKTNTDRAKTFTSSSFNNLMKNDYRFRKLHVGPHAPVPHPAKSPVTAYPSELPSSLPTSIDLNKYPSYSPSFVAPVHSSNPSDSLSDSPTIVPSSIPMGVYGASNQNKKGGMGLSGSFSIVYDDDDFTANNDKSGGKGNMMMI